MSLQDDLHHAHKARLARIASRAYPEKRPPRPQLRTWVPKVTVNISSRLYVPTPTDEMAWRLEICGIDASVDYGRVTIEAIQVAVCAYYGLSRTDMKSATKTFEFVRPRQVAVYLCRRLTLKSLPEIGRHFGKRDHTTMLHAVRKIRALMETDEELRGTVEMLVDRLGGDPL